MSYVTDLPRNFFLSHLRCSSVFTSISKIFWLVSSSIVITCAQPFKPCTHPMHHRALLNANSHQRIFNFDAMHVIEFAVPG